MDFALNCLFAPESVMMSLKSPAAAVSSNRRPPFCGVMVKPLSDVTEKFMPPMENMPLGRLPDVNAPLRVIV
ncbi:hypothetical protein D3C71_2076040 [compost metagenome]